MADMMDLDDLDDLNGQNVAPSRTGRFAPKNSKLKPQLKTKRKPKLEEEFDSVSEKKFESEPRHTAMADPVVAAKAELEPSHSPSADDCDVVKMDVEAKAVDDTVRVEDMAEEDSVVREIDVFFNPLIDSTTQLYVLQYPLRSCWRPYELDERCLEVRLKPTSSEFEIDLSIDVDSKNYDADGDHRIRMKKQTLSSSMKPLRANGIAVGMLRGNELHINPIRAAAQLRPSMEYLKPGGSNKNNVPSNKEDKDERSLGTARKQNKLPLEGCNESGEDWIPLEYHSSKSEFSTRYLDKMKVTEGSPIEFSMSPYDYVGSICPAALSDNNQPKGPPKGSLLTLPLEERFKSWFRQGPSANRFDTLKHLAPNNSIEDVFNALQKVACLVQGLWVPKSSVIFEEVPLALARDYVLLLFRKNPTISYDQLDNVKPKLSKVIKGMLSTLANDRPTLKDWKFKEAPDVMFVKHYPNIVKQQEQVWERAEKSILDSIFGMGRPSLVPKNPLKPDVASKHGVSNASSKGATRSSNGAVSRTMSNETREALPKALQKIFHAHKVCSYQQICQRLRETAVSESARPKGLPREALAAANAVDGPQEELMEILSQVATNIHGVYVSRTSPDNPQYDPLRKIVIELLIAEGPNAKLKRASIVEAAKLQLKREIPNAEFSKVMNELCVSQGAAWVLKRGDGNPN